MKELTTLKVIVMTAIFNESKWETTRFGDNVYWNMFVILLQRQWDHRLFDLL